MADDQRKSSLILVIESRFYKNVCYRSFKNVVTYYSLHIWSTYWNTIAIKGIPCLPSVIIYPLYNSALLIVWDSASDRNFVSVWIQIVVVGGADELLFIDDPGQAGFGMATCGNPYWFVVYSRYWAEEQLVRLTITCVPVANASQT